MAQEAGAVIIVDDFADDLLALDGRVTALESANPKVCVRLGSPQTVNEITGTAIVFDTEDWDLGPMHSGASDELIAPIDGIYDVKFYAVWETHTSGYRKINIRANGADVVGSGPEDGDGTEPLQQDCSCEVFLSAGDNLKGFVYYDSGGATGTLDIIGARMTARYIGSTS